MKKTTAVSTSVIPACLAQIATDVKIGLDDVVSVFITQWETKLHDKKDELSKNIKTVKQQLEDLDKKLTSSVDIKQFERDDKVWGLRSKVAKDGEDDDSFHVVWGKDHYDVKQNNICVPVEFFDTERKNRSDYPVHTKNVAVPIAAADVKKHTELASSLENLNAELIGTMGEIKSVSRKERQVRGKISGMKLEDAGMQELLNQPDLLRLIEVK